MDPGAVGPLLARLQHLPPEFQEVRQGIERALAIADDDPEMALTRARKVMELVVREVYERRIGEKAGTRPLDNLVSRLLKEEHVPTRIEAYATAVRKLGNVGTHAFGEKITKSDVAQALAQLAPVIEWWLDEERPDLLAGRAGATPATPDPRRAPPATRPAKSRGVLFAIVGAAVLALAAAGAIAISSAHETSDDGA